MASQSQEETLEILYADRDILVCIKPARVLSTDEPVVCLLWSEKHWGKKRQKPCSVNWVSPPGKWLF